MAKYSRIIVKLTKRNLLGVDTSQVNTESDATHDNLITEHHNLIRVHLFYGFPPGGVDLVSFSVCFSHFPFLLLTLMRHPPNSTTPPVNTLILRAFFCDTESLLSSVKMGGMAGSFHISKGQTLMAPPSLISGANHYREGGGCVSVCETEGISQCAKIGLFIVN